MMVLTTDQIIIAGLAAAVLLLMGYLVGSRGRSRARGKTDLMPLPPGAEALAPMFGDLRTQLDSVRGEVEQLRRSDVAEAARRGLEDQAWQSIQRVEQVLATLGQMPNLQQSFQEQISGAVRDLAALKEVQQAEQRRWTIEDEAFGRLQRISAVLLGSSTSGAAGERIVQEMLEALPAQWRVTNHTVDGRRVEFAVRLPDGLFLPIDSKVVAQAELDALDREKDAARRERLEDNVRTQVLKRVREVRQYVDERSVGFAIATVPDGVYRLCGTILPRAYQEHRALLVPYSLLGPFVLMVYEQHLRGGVDLDSARLGRLLSDAQEHLDRAAQELNGRLGNALVQVNNGRDALSRELAEAGHALALLRTTSSNGKPA